MTSTIEDQFIGKKLRERRTLLGVSQNKLGKLGGVTFQQIQKYEAGKNKLCASKLWNFAKILHVHIFYFFDGLEAVIQRNKLDEGVDISDIMRLRKVDAQQVKLGEELRKLSANFLKIKDAKLRKSVVELTKQLVESEKSEKKKEGDEK
jgi:transcriptional regulator with XRE-family HTH domain